MLLIKQNGWNKTKLINGYVDRWYIKSLGGCFMRSEDQGCCPGTEWKVSCHRYVWQPFKDLRMLHSYSQEHGSRSITTMCHAHGIHQQHHDFLSFRLLWIYPYIEVNKWRSPKVHFNFQYQSMPTLFKILNEC